MNSEQDSSKSKASTVHLQLAQRLVKRAPSKSQFPAGSAPFHVPHRKCLAQKQVESLADRNLICNLRGEPVEAEAKVEAEPKRREIPVKKALFTLPYSQSSFTKAQRQRDNRNSQVQGLIKRKIVPQLTDLNELIESKVKAFTDDSFIYLSYMVAKRSEYFTAYALAEVPFKRVDRSHFYTVSRRGVTFFSGLENHFTPLKVWQREYRQYRKLMEIPTFATFRLWKGFAVWRKGVVWRKYAAARRFLAENLFAAIVPLGQALLQLRAEYYRFMVMSFVDATVRENQHLFYFIEAQMLTYERARDALIEYRESMTMVLHQACLKAIVQKGYLPYDEALKYTTIKKMREMMSSTDRAKKRRFCILLTNFLSYCDYMTITFLHSMLADAFHQLASLFRAHDQCSPTASQLANLAIDRQLESPRPAHMPTLPFFIGELVLKPTGVEADPSRSVMLHIFQQLVDLILAAVYGMRRFQTDDTYRPFTEPSIMGRQEDRLGGREPSIDTVMDADRQMHDNRGFVFEAIRLAYDTAEVYVQRFEPIRRNYQQDVNTDPRTIRAERTVEGLRAYCERYNDEMRALEGIVGVIHLGVLQLKQDTFKEEVIPVCRDLLLVLDSHIPKIANTKVEELMSRAAALTVKLDTQPTDTVGFVDFMRYFAECGAQIEQLIAEIDYAYQCFVLMSDFGIFVDEPDKECYMDCEDTILGCKEILQARIDSKPELVAKLDQCLQQDIAELFVEIEKVRTEIMRDWLIDAASRRSEVNETLAVLAEQLAQSAAKVQEYRKYQREFKIDLTRFDALDAVTIEVRNRQLLWDTANEWEECRTAWNEQSFNTLNVEQLTDTSMRILKNCTMLEKNLPPNAIAPCVRQEVEVFKEKLPIIQFLRNPALKTRHWLRIEQIIDRKVFQDESVTLQLYEKAGAFTAALCDPIAEVSGQASAELGLEMLLKKVEMVWKETELSVIAHRDAKDVFILGGLDELQVALDESNININTLAASRHVGPIKSRVDDWQRLLELFAQTMDEWTTCQTSWIYLEAIFSAPDIQRQLPVEARMFLVVDKAWKDIMRRCYKQPLALPQMTDPQTLAAMRQNNLLLDRITKCLEAYLEVKRVSFPRFYFLSNDELLEILAQTRNPHAVQPHLRKCFDAIASLQFGTKETEGGQLVQTNDILALISPEGERVLLGVGLKARGPVEDWLGKVEEAMFAALKRCMKFAYKCYPTKDRSEWFAEHANQIVLTVSQQQWAVEVHAILEGPRPAVNAQRMRVFEARMVSDLAKLAAIARSDISKLLRKVLCALITIDVHARDTISGLVANKVTNAADFNWLKMLRYYWVTATETMQAKMSAAVLPYFYEYLGAGGVLVITPLTDRCYLCLMGALQMDLGGAPAGPAGTGKTETTKDLAKALAKQCVVFNCSEGLDYKMMGRFFSGLAQSGAWCCFDEFNRIDIEVLSVIAQQLITIRNAKAARMKRFMFEGREIKLNMSCAAFITMNPGYAGRTELPDNLKALFRPMSMMVPDYALIAEVILYSEGFEGSKLLAKKMVQMYKLCSEQLSQQDHYDFGMRAVKSVLVMAGALKRAAPEQAEDITLISALRDSNLPKFLSDDAVLFKGILSDLFPGVELPVVDYGALQAAIEWCMAEANLQPVPELITKNIQLYETMCVRWGVMLVGPTGGGKTCVLHGLAGALSKLFKDEVPGPNYRHVRMQTLNPKSISADELYGAVNTMTLEWKDGLLGLAVRYAVNVTAEEHQWIVCDGPVDAVWIENLNTVLDDNKMLCLANSERIKLTAWVHMVFEVQDLAQASPATVSRCGMVYVDPGELGWQPLVRSWRNTVSRAQMNEDLLDYLQQLFARYLEETLRFARRSCLFAIHQVEVSKVSMLCSLLKSLSAEVKDLITIDRAAAKGVLGKLFVWTMLWSVGGNFQDASRAALEQFVRQLIGDGAAIELPAGDLWNWKVNTQTLQWEEWQRIVEQFVYDAEQPYFDILVPTTDTAKFGFVAELLFRADRPVMFTGDTGVGKSVLAKGALRRLQQYDVLPVFINFSAQTSSCNTQDMMEARLEKRRRTLLGPPIGKRLVYFVDDVNMPKLDTYGSQPPIELLRQFLDFKGLFDRDKMFWKNIEKVTLGCACAPPGGGRNPLTPRFVRHFALLLLAAPNLLTLTAIFSAIIGGFLADFNSTVRPLADPIVGAAVRVYDRIARELLPTPAKSHYVFNLRDLSKCVQGILQADSSNYSAPLQLQRLFYHESMRVFHDRLINDEDKAYFRELMHETSVQFFGKAVVGREELVIFGDFMLFGQAREDRIYEEIKDVDRLKSVLFDYLDDWNGATGKDIKLILFLDAIQHVTRLARLLRAERANGLLVGLSGMGKQSLSRLGAHINGYRCVQIELSRGYDSSNFHDDLRRLYWLAGVQNAPTVFLITDTQICQEEFLEDINNILNSGEVPGLFEADEYEKVILGVRDEVVRAKCEDQSRDGMFAFFINRVRANLHIVLCMSPVGDAFRRRCRMFPSLVNCCTIDWFVAWPPEALYTVSLGSLAPLCEDQAEVQKLAETCVMMHETVEAASGRLFDEYRRHYYTTPSSFLELLKLYHILLKTRSDLIVAKRQRLANGLSKILDTNKLVDVMQVALKDMSPMLEHQSAEMSKLLEKLAVDNQVADAFKKRVLVDEADATEKAGVARGIADDANKDLAVAQPALLAAEDALKAINKNDINELKSFAQPPALVQFVMESVCILWGSKPSWEASKKIMADVNFLKRLMDFDKEHISEATLKKLKVYIEHKDFEPAKIEKVSKVAKSVSLWVVAMDQFAKIYKVVEPKIKKAREAEAELKGIMAILKQKQSELAEIEAHIQVLKDNIDEKNKEFKVIQDNVDLTMGRLNRAGRLTSALADEEIRWGNICEDLTAELWAVPGDVLIASAYVAYVGAFPTAYRKELCRLWVEKCRALKIPSSKEFNLVAVLGDAYEIRNWNMCQLPRDEVSIENGIVVTKALRWPLMIDPQEQANRWIRAYEGPNDLRITKITDPYLMRHLEICIRQGLPLLIEEIEETIDPSLGPVLGRLIFMQAGRPLIKLGDTDVDYDPAFRMYMTTKLSNPHYLPEVCVQVTLVNFLVTVDGLEDQLLAEIVAIELPAMEKQRSDLIVRINEDKQQLLLLEDRVLRLLFTATGNILDDEELVETLNESKETSAIIAARLIDTEETEKVITATREKYRGLAARGAVLFFVVATLAEIDPMYQFSLKYFTSVFCAVIAAPSQPLPLPQRLAQLMAAEIYAIYLNVSRGLFEKHKLVFSFLLAIAVERQEQRVTAAEFEFFLRGPASGYQTQRARPEALKIGDGAWTGCVYLEEMWPAGFDGLCAELPSAAFRVAMGEMDENIFFTAKKPGRLSGRVAAMKLFHRLLFVNLLAPDMCILALGSYIQETLGKHFTDVAGNATLPALYADTSCVVPLIFILSTGSDPMAAFLRFTADMQFMDKFYSISLGQGQGPAAELLIAKGRTLGHWVFLQNCHLATSWMPAMELIVRNLALGQLKAHPDFRLFLSSMPSRNFPVSVLQNSVKVTNEPPKGLKATLVRAFSDMERDFFERHALAERWRAMVFGLCMFHGVILERRKFGPLGWNITYEFTESDRESGLRTLDMYCDRESAAAPIPWAALEYINGEVTWGGRVTDYWDQRCLKTVLKIFGTAQIVQPGYQYSSSGVYRCPEGGTVEAFREYATGLPFNDDPEIFGMHENANLVFQAKETQFFVDTIMAGQPRAAGGGGGSGADDVVMGMIEKIGAALVRKISADEAYEPQMKLDEKGRVPSLTTVLLQETDRFNRLLAVIHDSLVQLKRAIRGFVVMSEQLEAVFVALLGNQVPGMWSKKGFLSTKSLGCWVTDFQHRVDYLQTWMTRGLPCSSWLSGLYFPQSFLTGTLQTHARRHNLPIDSLLIDYEVLAQTVVQAEVYERRQAGEKESPRLYQNVKQPESGVVVHGLFIEAGRWNATSGGLCDSLPGELVPRLPAVWIKPCTDVKVGTRYEAPLYKTQVRAGVLSTTGHSTNFVLTMYLKSKLPANFWILRGTALVTAVTE